MPRKKLTCHTCGRVGDPRSFRVSQVALFGQRGLKTVTLCRNDTACEERFWAASLDDFARARRSKLHRPRPAAHQPQGLTMPPKLPATNDLILRAALQIFCRQLAAERPHPPRHPRIAFLAKHAFEAATIFAAEHRRRKRS